MTKRSSNPFLGLGAETKLSLDAGERFGQAGHLWSQNEIDALILAQAAQRPLLVRGEAGSGKSQIARAAAKVLDEGEPLVEVIHPRFEAMDLLYRLDAVARLADAQVQQLDKTNNRYVKKGALWEAMERAETRSPVLLIDEIDKADADVPNALLDVLGNRSFRVDPLENRVVHAARERLPLIVITTNEERELPAAFVRRCVVLNLNPPEDGDAFVAWLVQRGAVHSHLEVADSVRTLAARQVEADRRAAVESGYPKVGLAEYIDLLTALAELTESDDPKKRRAQQREWLERLGAYALVKNPGQDQTRVPVKEA